MPDSKLRLLLVEDHPATLRAITSYLEQSYEVEAAADFATALEKGTRSGFDLMIADLSLPDGNGWELLERLQRRSPVKAIAMSGYGEERDLARSRTSGFLEHLVKPVTPEELEEAIIRALAAGEGEASEPGKGSRTE